jgi:signal transduction histidine kinase
MRRYFAELSLRAKLRWIASFSTSIALLTGGLILLTYDTRVSREALTARLRAEADVIGFNSASALLFRDDTSATVTLSALKGNPEVVGAVVYDEPGAPFASYAAERAAFTPPSTSPPDGERHDESGLVVVRPIVSEGRRVGTVVLRSDLRGLRARLRRFAVFLVLASVVAFGIALLASHRFEEAISRPVQSLATTARRVSEAQDYSVRAEGESQDELGLLVRSFNEMLAQIQRRDRDLEEARATLEKRVEERTAQLEKELEERRRGEEQIRRLNAENEARLTELTALNREIEAFSYSVSHDLRAPLRHINGFVDLLKDRIGSTLDEKSTRYLDVIVEGAKRMGRLIDDLLSFSRMSRTEMSERAVDLSRVVEDVIAEVMRDAGDREIAWDVGELPAVVGDRSMLRIVFVNLLSNAVKYTRGTSRAEIDVRVLSQADGSAVIRVRDNGVGFDMRYADKLFGVFQRLHRAEEFEGTGIGLATVQRIVHRHGGRVWAESVPGAGTSMFLTLRVAREVPA